MELQHLRIFLENNLEQVLHILYAASEEGSPCKQYMDSYAFRDRVS